MALNPYLPLVDNFINSSPSSYLPWGWKIYGRGLYAVYSIIFSSATAALLRMSSGTLIMVCICSMEWGILSRVMLFILGQSIFSEAICNYLSGLMLLMACLTPHSVAIINSEAEEASA